MYQFCISGSAKGHSVDQGKKLAITAGAALAEAGHSLMTGATSGLPDYAAGGYKKAGGKMSFGISPAASKPEHLLKYRLPTENYDVILYTGLHYVGRDALLINSSDAVISIGGRLGTLHEFTIAVETKTPIGFLDGAGGIGEEIPELIKMIENVDESLIVFDDDPERLVAKLTKLLNKQNAQYKRLYS